MYASDADHAVELGPEQKAELVSWVSAKLKRPVAVPEVVATVYHRLGIDPKALLYDRQNRPVPILPEAEPVHELLG